MHVSSENNVALVTGAAPAEVWRPRKPSPRRARRWCWRAIMRHRCVP